MCKDQQINANFNFLRQILQKVHTDFGSRATNHYPAAYSIEIVTLKLVQTQLFTLSENLRIND